MKTLFTPLAATYANEDRTAVVARVRVRPANPDLPEREDPAMLLSEADTPDLWPAVLALPPSAYVAPPPPPRDLAAAWVKAALAEMGVIGRIRASLTPLQSELFEGATAFREDHPMILGVGRALGLDVKAVFDRAEAIREANT